MKIFICDERQKEEIFIRLRRENDNTILLEVVDMYGKSRGEILRICDVNSGQAYITVSLGLSKGLGFELDKYHVKIG